MSSGFSLSILSHAHTLVKLAFRRAGYRFEVRRSGDLQLGLWRSTLRASVPAGQPVRRLVLLPGLGDTPVSWLSVILLLQPILRKQFDEVVMVDFPGFTGFLSKEKCFVSMDALLEQASDAIDSLKPQTLIGHSLGGWIAAHYAVAAGEGSRPKARAADREQRVYEGPERLILVAPSGIFGTLEEGKRWAERFYRAIREGVGPLREALFAKEPIWFGLVAGPVSSFLQREDTVQFIQSFDERHSLEGKLSHIKAQTWILWGDRDKLVPSDWASHWLKELVRDEVGKSQATAVFLRGIGHSPQIESPARTAAILAHMFLGKDVDAIPLSRRWWRT